jgi:hypothetical protein
MAILLPSSPLPLSATPEPRIFGGWLTPTMGGEEQFLARIGNRFAMTVTTPRLKPEPDGRLWVAALVEAWMTGGVVAMPFPQPGLEIGDPGAPVVDGAGQSGSLLRIRGFAPGYAMRRGQFFPVRDGGRRYLHMATAATVAGADGRLTLPVAPMLRIRPGDGALCDVARPMIEGKPGGDRAAWTHVRARMQGLTFTITEIA